MVVENIDTSYDEGDMNVSLAKTTSCNPVHTDFYNVTSDGNKRTGRCMRRDKYLYPQFFLPTLRRNDTTGEFEMISIDNSYTFKFDDEKADLNLATEDYVHFIIDFDRRDNMPKTKIFMHAPINQFNKFCKATKYPFIQGLLENDVPYLITYKSAPTQTKAGYTDFLPDISVMTGRCLFRRNLASWQFVLNEFDDTYAKIDGIIDLINTNKEKVYNLNRKDSNIIELIGVLIKDNIGEGKYTRTKLRDIASRIVDNDPSDANKLLFDKIPKECSYEDLRNCQLQVLQYERNKLNEKLKDDIESTIANDDRLATLENELRQKNNLLKSVGDFEINYGRGVVSVVSAACAFKSQLSSLKEDRQAQLLLIEQNVEAKQLKRLQLVCDMKRLKLNMVQVTYQNNDTLESLDGTRIQVMSQICSLRDLKAESRYENLSYNTNKNLNNNVIDELNDARILKLNTVCSIKYTRAALATNVASKDAIVDDIARLKIEMLSSKCSFVYEKAKLYDTLNNTQDALVYIKIYLVYDTCKLKSLRKQISDQTIAKDNINEQVDDLVRQKTNLTQEVETLRKENRKLIDERDDLRNKVARLRENVAEIEDSVSFLKLDKINEVCTLISFKREKELLNKDIKELQDNKSKIIADTEELVNKKTSADETLTSVTEALDGTNIKRLMQVCVMKGVGQDIDTLNATLDDMKETRLRLAQETNIAKIVAICNAKQMKDDLIASTNKLRDELEEVRSVKLQRMDEVCGVISLRREKQLLDKDIKELNDTKSKITKDTEELVNKKTSADETLVTLTETLDGTNIKRLIQVCGLRDAVKEIDTLNTTLDDLKETRLRLTQATNIVRIVSICSTKQLTSDLVATTDRLRVELEEKIAKLRTDLDELNEQKSIAESTNTSLSNRTEDLNDILLNTKILVLSNVCTMMGQKIQSEKLNKETAALQELLYLRSDDLVQVRTSRLDEVCRLRSVRTDLSNVRIELATSQEVVSNLIDDRDSLKIHVLDDVCSLRSLRSELSSVRNDLVASRQILSDLLDDRDGLKVQALDVKCTTIRYKERRDAVRINFMQSVCLYQSLQRDMAKVLANKNTIQNEYDTMSELLDKTSWTYASIAISKIIVVCKYISVSRIYTDLSVKKEALQTTVNQLENDRSNKTDELTSLQINVVSYKCEHNRISTIVQQKLNANRTLDNDIVYKKSELENLEDTVFGYQTVAIAAMLQKCSVKQLRTDVGTLSKLRTGLVADVDLLRSDVVSLDVLKSDVEKKREELLQLETERDRLRADVDRFNGEFIQMTRDNDELTNILRQLNEDKKRLEDERDKLIGVIDNVTVQGVKCTKLKDTTKLLAQLDEELDAKRRQLNEVVSALETLIGSEKLSNVQLENNNNENKRLQITLQKLRQNVGELEEKERRLTSAIVSLNDNIEQLQNNLDRIRRSDTRVTPSKNKYDRTLYERNILDDVSTSINALDVYYDRVNKAQTRILRLNENIKDLVPSLERQFRAREAMCRKEVASLKLSSAAPWLLLILVGIVVRQRCTENEVDAARRFVRY